MELDDQLAALAAGELDDDTAHALRARAAADPALARRLARHERLQELLTSWEAPPLDDAATARIDAAIDAALADLDDGPLAAPATPAAATRPPAALPDTAEDDERPDAAAASAAAARGVTDLAAARDRRDRRRGVPSWVPGTAVAAALLAVVGVGVTVGGGLDGFGGDDAGEVMADSATDESAESGLAESDTTEESMDEEQAAEDEVAALAPTIPDDLDVAEGDLLTLLDPADTTISAEDGADGTDDTDSTDDADGGTDDGAGTADDDATRVEADACVVEALERDTEAVTGREVTLLAAGTYAGEPAQFVVVRSPGDSTGDRYDVLAYDPTSCALLDRDTEVR